MITGKSGSHSSWFGDKKSVHILLVCPDHQSSLNTAWHLSRTVQNCSQLLIANNVIMQNWCSCLTRNLSHVTLKQALRFLSVSWARPMPQIRGTRMEGGVTQRSVPITSQLVSYEKKSIGWASQVFFWYDSDKDLMPVLAWHRLTVWPDWDCVCSERCNVSLGAQIWMLSSRI